LLEQRKRDSSVHPLLRRRPSMYKTALNVQEDGIEKSKSDEREYRALVLPNELQVLLASDKKSEKAAAAMDVNVGHFSDPEEIPGLAHFLEHMLFLGTEKYPDENGYSAFLNDHGGRSNAFTSMEHTNYFFDVGFEHLQEALDRFAQFFIGPLFTESATGRELNAVDSEHAKNLQDDMWRTFQLEKTTSNPAHPYHKFATGDSGTLRDIPASAGINVHSRLIEFHKRYYSANRMRLVVLGRDDLDTLEEWVSELFAAIPNTNADPPSYGPNAGHPISEQHMGRIIEFVPVKELRTIELTWPAPSLRDKYEIGPERYLSNLLGHEGPGSILSALKKLGWANELSCGLACNNSDFSFLKLTVDCTVEGIKHVSGIIRVVYAYLKVLQKNNFLGVQEWLWKEVATQTANSFRFQSPSSPSNFVSGVASKLQLFPAERVLASGLLRKYDRQVVVDLLDLLKPSRMQAMVADQNFQDVAMESEKWYKTKYRIRKFDEETLKTWEEGNLDFDVDLHLPDPNEFLPTDFTIFSFETPDVLSIEGVKARIDAPALPNGCLQEALEILKGTVPLLKFNASKMLELPVHEPWEDGEDVWRPPVLLDAGAAFGGFLWFKQDISFKMPKTVISVMLRSPEGYRDARSAVLTELYIQLVQDHLNEYAYAAEIAGLFYQIRNTTMGIVLTVGGFHHKVDVLLEKIMETLCDPSKVGEMQFFRFKERLTQDYKNFQKEQPYQHAIYESTLLLSIPRWHMSQKLKAIEETISSREDVVEHARRILRSTGLETLVVGNATPDIARKLAKLACSKFFAKTLDPMAVLEASALSRVVAIPKQSESFFAIERRDPENSNSAIETIFQLGPYVPKLKAQLQVLVQLAQEPSFNYLRTQEQLGYIVFCGLRLDMDILAMRLIVQSNRADPMMIDEKIESFLDLFEKQLREMEQAQLDRNIKAVVEGMLEKDKTTAAQLRRFSGEVESQFYEFTRTMDVARAVMQVTKDDLIEFFMAYIAKVGRRRKKVSVGIFGKDTTLPTSSLNSPKVLIESIEAFRADNETYPSRRASSKL